MGKAVRVVCALLVATILGCTWAQHDPHFTGNRTTLVHLFEWRWNDIAEECERFLGPQGYGGVQTSPPSENLIFNDGVSQRPWWERYQPISYKLETRSGTEEEFKSMVRRCNDAGVRIYVDAVVNHMTAYTFGTGRGTGGSYYDSANLMFEAVPYTSEDFHVHGECPSASGGIDNPQDPNQIRNCRLGDLSDLNQARGHVRDMIYEYLNRLVNYGVAGFRFDAAKHMWPADMKAILDRLDNLPTTHGFPQGARAFVYQEVQDFGDDSVHAADYFENGRVTEFKVCPNLGDIFRHRNSQQLRYLKNWGEAWSFMPDAEALVFVDNHDNQRYGADNVLTFREPKLYKMAQAFTLAWPYGLTRVMSSYYWDSKDGNTWTGPPSDANFNILPVTINSDQTCGNGWICEHRWQQINHMVRFRNVVKGTEVNNFWDNGKDQIAFSRGNRGFIAINNDNVPLDATLQTSLPAGTYCDVITGIVLNGRCTGRSVVVSNDGTVKLYISAVDEDPVIAIHVEARL